jgi:hypothetical protein
VGSGMPAECNNPLPEEKAESNGLQHAVQPLQGHSVVGEKDVKAEQKAWDPAVGKMVVVPSKIDHPRTEQTGRLAKHQVVHVTNVQQATRIQNVQRGQGEQTMHFDGPPMKRSCCMLVAMVTITAMPSRLGVNPHAQQAQQGLQGQAWTKCNWQGRSKQEAMQGVLTREAHER